MRVLVVDDELSIRLLLAAALEVEGFQVVHADCARRAVQLLDDRRFDVVLLDVMLDGEDGLGVLQWLRMAEGRACRTPVVVVTALADGPQRTEALLVGADEVVGKPFDVVGLADLLREVTARDAGARRAARQQQLAASRRSGLVGL